MIDRAVCGWKLRESKLQLYELELERGLLLDFRVGVRIRIVHSAEEKEARMLKGQSIPGAHNVRSEAHDQRKSGID